MQLQVWQGDSNLSAQTSSSRETLNTPDEKVTWTQYLKKDSVLKFGVSAASSQTWGDFSGVEVTIPGGSTNLDTYSADYSKSNSAITYGANRVTSLKLLKVRRTYSNGNVTEDATVRIVYPADSATNSSGTGTSPN